MAEAKTENSVWLGPGTVGQEDARLWYRCSNPGPHDLVLSGDNEVRRHRLTPALFAARNGTGVVQYPQDFGAPSLKPDTVYEAVLSGGVETRSRTARFRTNHSRNNHQPRTYAIGFASCHQPFSSGFSETPPHHTRLLDQLPAYFDKRRVRRVILLGDQMYADEPSVTSLYTEKGFAEYSQYPHQPSIFDCGREEVRAVFQKRYERFWGVSAWQDLLSRFPCTMVPDDHEIIDNVGSDPAHDRPRWTTIRQGAMDAFWDYQGIRAQPRPASGESLSAAHSLVYGSFRMFAMDIRSDRRFLGDRCSLANEPQWSALASFLHNSPRDSILCVGLSVPLVHLPGAISGLLVPLLPDGSALDDRWSAPQTIHDRDRLLDMLRRHRERRPRQPIILLSGDIHIGFAHELRWNGHAPVYQLISSGVSNPEHPVVRWGSAFLGKLNEGDPFGDPPLSFRRLNGRDGHTSNPHLGLNAGLVEVEERDASGPRFRLSIVGFRDGQDSLTDVYQSEWLGR